MKLPGPSPYAPGAGAQPPELVGRDPYLQQCRSLLSALEVGAFENSMLVSGMRGVGKTVLLNQFESIAQEQGWQCEIYEMQNDGNLPTALARICRRLLLELSTKARAKDRALRALGVLKAFTATLEGVEFKLDVDAALGRADSGHLRDDLRDLLVEVGEAAQAGGSGVLLLIDELQLVPIDQYEALIIALHRVTQKNLPIAFVGAGLPTTRALSAEAKTYSERMFKSAELKALSPEDAREAIGAPARSRGVLIDDDALNLILAMSGCYPFFLQKYAHEVWKLAEDNRITRVDAQNAQPIVQADLDEGFFAIRIGIATPAERDYMVALAGLGDGPQNVTTIAKRAGYRDANSAAPHRDALLKKGLIWAPARGTLDFTAPWVGDYLRRRYLT